MRGPLNRGPLTKPINVVVMSCLRAKHYFKVYQLNRRLLGVLQLNHSYEVLRVVYELPIDVVYLYTKHTCGSGTSGTINNCIQIDKFRDISIHLSIYLSISLSLYIYIYIYIYVYTYKHIYINNYIYIRPVRLLRVWISEGLTQADS